MRRCRRSAYVQDVEITPLALPAAAGGDLPLTYALTGPASDPALPEGAGVGPKPP